MTRAVLDACVLIPSVLADTLLRCAEYELYIPHWSDEILREVRRNLPVSVTDTAAHRRITMMNRFFPNALVTGYETAITDMANHPKDRHVLAAAVTCGADFIVTANVRDFPDAVLAAYAIEATHPDDFLCDFYRTAPDLVAEIIIEQAEDTGRGGRPKLSTDDVLAGLRGCRVTRFAAGSAKHS